MNNRPSFEVFKEKAMQRDEVKAEYNALMPIFELKKQNKWSFKSLVSFKNSLIF